MKFENLNFHLFKTAAMIDGAKIFDLTLDWQKKHYNFFLFKQKLVALINEPTIELS